ncbi:MAG: hypothetical protein AB7T19_19060 [Planctomycetota bacterium]
MVRSRQRLFLAFELPAALRNRLAECSRGLAAEFPDLRATAEADLHLTLVFLARMIRERRRKIDTGRCPGRSYDGRRPKRSCG